jgi:DNA-binding response OmpR family regulator
MSKRILVVDDDESVRDSIEILLNIAGFHVFKSATGSDIFQTIQFSRPDLILLDIHLGDSDGREICKAVKTNPATSAIPIIMVSAEEKIYNAIVTSGANDVVSKPFTEDVLLSRVHRQLASAC